MGRLVDQDYLWLRESTPRTQPGRLRRWLPFGLVPLAAAGVWYGFYTSPDNNKQADNTAPTSYVDDSGPGHVPAVAQGPSAASVRPVNLIQPLSQAPGAPTVRRAIADTLTMAPASDLIGDAAHPGWRSVDIEQGDTLSLAFERAGLSYMDSLHIAHMPKLGHYFTRGLRAGAHLQVEADTAGRVQNLVYPIDAARTITLTRDGDTFTGDLARKVPGECVAVSGQRDRARCVDRIDQILYTPGGIGLDLKMRTSPQAAREIVAEFGHMRDVQRIHIRQPGPLESQRQRVALLDIHRAPARMRRIADEITRRGHGQRIGDRAPDCRCPRRLRQGLNQVDRSHAGSARALCHSGHVPWAAIIDIRSGRGVIGLLVIVRRRVEAVPDTGCGQRDETERQPATQPAGLRARR